MSSDPAQKSSTNARDVVILYGSQTGNAIDVSERVAEELQRKWFQIKTFTSMDEYAQSQIANLIKENIIIFVASTTGQGDTPDNMKKFWKFILRKNLPRTSLSRVRFTVFGLGDSSYPKYNVVARRLYQRLLDLGGVSLHPRGLGDDQHDFGYDKALIPWLDSLSLHLETLHPLPPGRSVLPKHRKPDPKYTVSVVALANSSSSTQALLARERSQTCNGVWGGIGTNYTPFYARLVRHARLTPNTHWQDVRLLTFDLGCGYHNCEESRMLDANLMDSHNVAGMAVNAPKPSDFAYIGAMSQIDSKNENSGARLNIKVPELKYDPGDVLLLHPRNSDAAVSAMLDLMDWKDLISNYLEADVSQKEAILKNVTGASGSGSIRIDASKNIILKIGKFDAANVVGGDLGLPPVLTLYELFSKYLDICGTPRRTFFEKLVHFCSAPDASQALESTANETGDETDESAEAVHRRKLLELSSTEGQLALFEYNQLEARRYYEVLKDFYTCRVPLHYLIGMIPKLKARKFSISSSMRYYTSNLNCRENGINVDYVNGGKKGMKVTNATETKDIDMVGNDASVSDAMDAMHASDGADESGVDMERRLCEITVALVEYETPLKRKRKGICSEYIASLPMVDGTNQDGVYCAVWLEKGSFRLKKNWMQNKAIFIGPGTGIAPFRAMCQERYHLMNKKVGGTEEKTQESDANGAGEKVDQALVFFGNRNKKNDFFYENEWNKLMANGVNGMNRKGSVFRLFSAFSRDTQKKVYVQHKIKENGELVWQWIDKHGCYVFLAGSSEKMPNDVRKALIQVIGKYGNMSENDASKYFAKLEQTFRYQSETWS